MKRWFTSDTHFGHQGILGHCGRPWETVEQMDAALIKRWNEVVAPGDIVYHLGDFSFHRPQETTKVLRKLNGQIILIEGNHDKMKADVRNMFHQVTKLHEIRGAWMLHGHSHGTLRSDCFQCGFDPDKKRLDVGVDVHNYYPISFEEVKQIMDAKEPFTPVDHHKSPQARMLERAREGE